MAVLFRKGRADVPAEGRALLVLLCGRVREGRVHHAGREKPRTDRMPVLQEIVG